MEHDPKRTTHLIYHGRCYDGFGAAWAGYRALGPELALFPAVYGSKPPTCLDYEPESAHVVIADFSYPRPVLEELRSRVASLVILDHHKTAEEALRGFPGAVFDMEHSGARLAWDYFHPGQEPPPLIDYLEDRDLWRFKLNGSREISAYIQSYGYDLQLWDEIAADLYTNKQALISQGAAVLRGKHQMVDEMAANFRMLDVGGYIVPVANAACYFSEVAEALCEMFPDKPFAAYYMDRADGKRQWGMRSRGGFDVSAVAKLYGGGGHPAAAGFTTEVP